MAWHEDHAELVQRLAAENLTSQVIADALLSAFGKACTASAVIGLCFRRGWKLNETKQSRTRKGRNAARPKQEREKRPAARRGGPTIPLLKLEEWHCRTVVIMKGEDRLAEYCGRRKAPGRSYCAACQSRYIDRAATAAMDAELAPKDPNAHAYTPRMNCW